VNVAPACPAVAMAAHVEGFVIVEATISGASTLILARRARLRRTTRPH